MSSPPSVQGGEGILDFFQLRGGKKIFERQGGTFRVGKLNFPDFQGGGNSFIDKEYLELCLLLVQIIVFIVYGHCTHK